MNGPVSTTVSKDKSARQASERSPERPRQPAVSGPQADILALQRAAGNQAVSQSLQSDAGRPGLIQAKLAVSQPGDKYEQEADRVAEQVMRMPENEATGISTAPEKIQRECATCVNGEGPCPKCEEEETIQRKPLVSAITPLVQRQLAIPEEEEEEFLQTKLPPGSTPSVTPHIVANINAMRGDGQPLQHSERAFFEQRFGADFSQVRVHTGPKAAETAQSINARAYTLGKDVVFGEGQYSPYTNAGRYLLAHELVHTIQQGRQNRDGEIQRKLGFEFQTGNRIVKHKTGKKLKRPGTKEKPIKPVKPKIGSKLKMEVDEAHGSSVIEFVTGAYDEWEPLGKDIDDAVKIIEEIKGLDKKPSPQLGTVYSGFQTENYGPLDIEVRPFTAKPQSTEDISLEEFPSLLKEHGRKKLVEQSLKAPASILKGKKDHSKLKGFLTLIVYYLKLFKRKVLGQKVTEEPELPKSYIRLMTRVDFVSLYGTLSEDEQELFRDIVEGRGKRANPIEEAAGVEPDDALFPSGYWIHYRKKSRKIQDLLITDLLIIVEEGKWKVKAIWAEEEPNYRECNNLSKENPELHKEFCTKPPSKIRRHKNKRVATVRNWLKSMYAKTYKRKVKRKGEKRRRRRYVDLLSPLPGWGGSQERGYGIGTWPLFGGLAAFEMRGYPGRLLYSEWKKFAFNSFNRAAQSGRKRGGLVVPTAKLEGRSWGLEFGGASLAGEKGPYGRLSIPLGGSQLGAAGLTRLTYGLQLTGMTIRDQNSFMIGFNLGLSTRTSRSSHSLGAGIDASILYDLAGSLGVVPELGGHLGLSLRDLELGTAGKLGTRDVTLGMFGRVGAPLGPKKINPYLVLGFRIGYEW